VAALQQPFSAQAIFIFITLFSFDDVMRGGPFCSHPASLDDFRLGVLPGSGIVLLLWPAVQCWVCGRFSFGLITNPLFFLLDHPFPKEGALGIFAC